MTDVKWYLSDDEGKKKNLSLMVSMQNMLISGAQISREDTLIFVALHTIDIYLHTKFSGKLL